MSPNVVRRGTCDVICLRVSTGVTGSQKREPRYSWDRRRGESCHLTAVGAPVGAGGRKGLDDGGCSGLCGTSTEHNAAGEDGGLSTIVVGHLGLGVVDKDLGSASAFPARHLWLGRVGSGEGVDTLRVGESGGARRRSRVGGHWRVIGRPVDGGEGVGGEWGLDGREVGLDGGDPCWLSDVIGEDSKQFVLFLRVIFEQLLSKSLALNGHGDHRGFRTSRGSL